MSRQAHQQSNLHDQRIAAIVQVEFKTLGRINRGAPRRKAVLSCKRHRGAFEQENSADLTVGVAGHPKAFLVAADEKCRDGLTDDGGIERLKWRVDAARLIGWQYAETLAILRNRVGRTSGCL